MAGLEETGRSCGPCSLCCKLMAIGELAKPAGQWCRHAAGAAGCRIYADRPAECRSFACGWLIDPKLGEEWRPSISRIVLVAQAGENRLTAHVDPARPDAWRRKPYYARLKQWAHAAVRARGQVVVYVGRHATVILPDRDIDLGPVADDEVVVTTINGRTLDACKITRDRLPHFECGPTANHNIS